MRCLCEDGVVGGNEKWTRKERKGKEKKKNGITSGKLSCVVVFIAYEILMESLWCVLSSVHLSDFHYLGIA